MLIEKAKGDSPLCLFALTKAQKYEDIFVAIKKRTHAIIKSIVEANLWPMIFL